MLNRAELALAWFGGYDSYDLLSLAVLAHSPPVSFDHNHLLLGGSWRMIKIIRGS